MESILGQIAHTGNIAVLVLTVVCGGLYSMLREERKLEREARREDAKHCAEAIDRQTTAVIGLTHALTELQLEEVRRKT